MQAVYRLSADELDMNFLDSIKKLFKTQKLYINISTEEPDETDYLLSSPANAERLLKAINNIENHPETLIQKSIEDLG
jgi:antitoxin YefM